MILDYDTLNFLDNKCTDLLWVGSW